MPICCWLPSCSSWRSCSSEACWACWPSAQDWAEVYRLARPLLFGLDAERAHRLTLEALEHAFAKAPALLGRAPEPLPTRAFGLEFANPVGLAAGLDKDGAHIDALFGLGFGFVEIGTVTPRPQPGNPMPRLFRLPGKRAVINRMGFNNAGVDVLVRN